MANNGLPQIGLIQKHYPAISKIVISPSNPNILYVGMVESLSLLDFGSRGIYRSTDGGQSWVDVSIRRLGIFLISQPVLDIAVNPRNPNNVIVGLASNGVYITSDGGRRWRQVQRGKPPPPGAVSYHHIVRFAPSQPTLFSASFTYYSGPIPMCSLEDCIEVTGVFPEGLLKSINGGTRWQSTEFSNAFPTDLAIHPSNSNILYASTMGVVNLFIIPVCREGQGILKSTDGGRSWTPVNNGIPKRNVPPFPITCPPEEYIPIVSLAIDYTRPDRLYAASFEGVFYSSDGGTNWRQFVSPGLPNPIFIKKIWVSPNGQRLYASTSEGLYWLDISNRPPIANAGPDQTVQVGSTVQLDGSGSSDPDGDPIKSYRWNILPRENSAQCVFKSSRNIAQPTIQPRREGSCTIELVVSDGKLNSAPDQVTITAKTDVIPPALIQDFQASDNADGRSILAWANPSDSDLAEVIVRRKTSSYPTSHNDGDLVYQNTNPTPGAAITHTDTGLTNGTIYYYAVFSRDKVGNWNDQVVEGKNADTGRPQVPPPPPSATAPWPMFQHDAQRSGRSPYVGPQGPNVKWTFQDSSIPFWEPVVAADGTIYVGGGYTGDIGGFYAINPDGSLKWVNNSIRVFEGPVLGPEGQIYVIAYAYPDNHPFLLALNPDGTERWRYEWFSVDYYDAELVIDENGNIYHLTGCYSQSDQRVHPSLLAFNPQGSIIWLYDITDRQTYPNGVCVVSGLTLGGSASSALDKEGNIYAMVSFPPELDGTILFALRPDGTEKWRRTFDGWAAGISIDQDGTIYASVGGYGKIYAIDPSSPNHDKWVVYVQGLGSAVTIGTEDIYVTGGSAPDGTWRSYLYAFDKQGNAKWQKFIGYEATSVPILGGDGTIYIGARQWRVYAFRPDGSEKWSSSECAVFGDDAVSAGGSLAIAADGTLYTAGPQKLCAFGESVAGSISAPGEVLAVQAYPGSVRFLAAEAMALRVEVFNLAGRRIYDSGLVSGNSLYWDGLMSDGRRLANGVYLYVVTIRKQDGTILRSQVKKLVILR
jgi:hypothetical protein